MLNNTRTRTKRWMGKGLAVMAGALLLPFVQGALKAADIPALFQEAKISADQLRRDAVQMESFSRSKTSWQNHAAQITGIKEHTNRASQIVSQLQEAHGDAEAWHQEAIDRVTDHLKELASHTESIIEHLNTTPNHLWDPTYKQYLQSNAELAGKLSKLIADTVEYDTTRAKIQSLQEKLDGLSS
jgi:hypothetical protein